jgi:hypothetical protein
MFIEGARLLGFSMENRLPLDVQKKILCAADVMARKLVFLLDFQGNLERDPELDN